ncbi:hypothetical protein FGO68_gene4608 [Halteria grandinella]|uniref:Transmembrane protein n=1 Tax=Halteria grandinella TaxID=5974 RepID=A0A8J8NG39_HALGN|nr:hypothetical protein FGO68_gene4608 [Halteria grandinella]
MFQYHSYTINHNHRLIIHSNQYQSMLNHNNQHRLMISFEGVAQYHNICLFKIMMEHLISLFQSLFLKSKIYHNWSPFPSIHSFPPPLSQFFFSFIHFIISTHQSIRLNFYSKYNYSIPIILVILYPISFLLFYPHNIILFCLFILLFLYSSFLNQCFHNLIYICLLYCSVPCLPFLILTYVFLWISFQFKYPFKKLLIVAPLLSMYKIQKYVISIINQILILLSQLFYNFIFFIFKLIKLILMHNLDCVYLFLFLNVSRIEIVYFQFLLILSLRILLLFFQTIISRNITVPLPQFKEWKFFFLNLPFFASIYWTPYLSQNIQPYNSKDLKLVIPFPLLIITFRIAILQVFCSSSQYPIPNQLFAFLTHFSHHLVLAQLIDNYFLFALELFAIVDCPALITNFSSLNLLFPTYWIFFSLEALHQFLLDHFQHLKLANNQLQSSHISGLYLSLIKLMFLCLEFFLSNVPVFFCILQLIYYFLPIILSLYLPNHPFVFFLSYLKLLLQRLAMESETLPFQQICNIASHFFSNWSRKQRFSSTQLFESCSNYAMSFLYISIQNSTQLTTMCFYSATVSSKESKRGSSFFQVNSDLMCGSSCLESFSSSSLVAYDPNLLIYCQISKSAFSTTINMQQYIAFSTFCCSPFLYPVPILIPKHFYFY